MWFEVCFVICWWWLGSVVDVINLIYNLEEYVKVGLGGVEIIFIYGV